MPSAGQWAGEEEEENRSRIFSVPTHILVALAASRLNIYYKQIKPLVERLGEFPLQAKSCGGKVANLSDASVEELV